MNEVFFFFFHVLLFMCLVGGDDPRQWSEDDRGECEGQETLPLPRRSEVSIYNFSFPAATLALDAFTLLS